MTGSSAVIFYFSSIALVEAASEPADLGEVCRSFSAEINRTCKEPLRCGDPEWDGVADTEKKCVEIEADGTVKTGLNTSKKPCLDGDLEYEHGTKFGTTGLACNGDGRTFEGEERVCLDGKMEIVNRPKETCPDFRPFCCQWKEPGTSGSIKCSASKDDCTPWKKKVSTAVPATTTTKTTAVDKVTDGRCNTFKRHCADGQQYKAWMRKYCAGTCSRDLGADLGDVCYSLEAGPDPCKAGLKCGDPKYDNVPDATKKCVRIEDDGTVTTGASFYKSCQDGDLEYEHGTRFGTIGTTCNDDMKTFQGEEKVCIDGKFQTVKRQAQACQRFRPYCCQKGQPGKSGSVMCSASKDSCTSWKQKGLRIKASEHRDNALPKHSLAGAIGLSGAVAAVMLFAF